MYVDNCVFMHRSENMHILTIVYSCITVRICSNVCLTYGLEGSHWKCQRILLILCLFICTAELVEYSKCIVIIKTIIYYCRYRLCIVINKTIKHCCCYRLCIVINKTVKHYCRYRLCIVINKTIKHYCRYRLCIVINKTIKHYCRCRMGFVINKTIKHYCHYRPLIRALYLPSNRPHIDTLTSDPHFSSARQS